MSENQSSKKENKGFCPQGLSVSQRFSRAQRCVKVLVILCQGFKFKTQVFKIQDSVYLKVRVFVQKLKRTISIYTLFHNSSMFIYIYRHRCIYYMHASFPLAWVDMNFLRIVTTGWIKNLATFLSQSLAF